MIIVRWKALLVAYNEVYSHSYRHLLFKYCVISLHKDRKKLSRYCMVGDVTLCGVTNCPVYKCA